MVKDRSRLKWDMLSVFLLEYYLPGSLVHGFSSLGSSCSRQFLLSRPLDNVLVSTGLVSRQVRTSTGPRLSTQQQPLYQRTYSLRAIHLIRKIQKIRKYLTCFSKTQDCSHLRREHRVAQQPMKPNWGHKAIHNPSFQNPSATSSMHLLVHENRLNIAHRSSLNPHLLNLVPP